MSLIGVIFTILLWLFMLTVFAVMLLGVWTFIRKKPDE